MRLLGHPPQRENPHAAQLMSTFELAGTGYGRVDYGFSKGRLQVFEINTNSFVHPPASVQRTFRPSLEWRKRRFVAAMTALDVAARESPYTARVPVANGFDRVEAPTRARRLLRRGPRALHLFHREHSPSRLRNRLRSSRPPRLSSSPPFQGKSAPSG